MRLERTNRVPIRLVFPGTVPFFIQMSRVNFKSPAFPKYPPVFSLINAIWTDEKKNRLRIETVKALIIVKTYFKNLSCAEFCDQILNEKEILELVHKSDKYFSN
jgi:hypothetical protein